MSADTVRPFRRRRGEPLAVAIEGRFGFAPAHDIDATLAQEASPELDVRLAKDGRQRRYLICRGRNVSEWYCQVWFGGTQHRGDRVEGVAAAQRSFAQYRREIEELALDGWAIVE